MTDTPVSSQGVRADGARAADAVEALSDAVGAIAGVLDLEAVLQLIVDRARTLVPAH